MEQEDVVNSAFKLGIRHFQDQNYTKLLKIFSKAIDLAQSYDENHLNVMVKNNKIPNTKLIHPKLSSLLDSRALTYEKLGNFRQAGKDGEDLIEIDPFNCKGYLRVAKILILLDSKVDAYKVLAKGQRKIQQAIAEGVLKQTSLFDQLIRQKKSLAESLRQPTSLKRSSSSSSSSNDIITKNKKSKLRNLDPLVRLPIEIFKLVLSIVPFRDMGNLLLVCKNWNSVISSIPEFWSRIEIRKPVSSISFKKLYNKIIMANQGRYHKRIDYLKLIPRRNDEKNVMNIILNLTKLQIINLQIVLQDFDCKKMLILLLSSKLARYNFGKLQDLQIESSLYLNFENYLFEALPNLRNLELIINGIKTSRNIVELERDTEDLAQLESNYKMDKQYKKLVKLSVINKTQILTSKLPFEIFLESDNFPNLQTLIIVGFKINKMSIFAKPNLKEIILEQNPELTLSNFLSNCPNTQLLQTLYLREYKISNDGVIPNIPSLKLENLKILDLTGCSINFNSLIRILQLTDENLQILNIGSCSNLIWQSSAFDRSRNLCNFQEIIRLCPNLIKISLNQSTNLNDFTLKMMGQILLSNYQFFKFESMDLSFNNISGHGLIEFFQMHDKPNRIKVQNLIVDGDDIKMETLKFLMNKGYIENLQYEFAKRNWKQFGVNSYIP